ncbi:hypothetical protein Purlil1_14012 [Purpureocillium lilacinum]|uniref:Uncharacterized protein n=1 Tax=Purpureocillium lilacinum TaxID=33203 RepID=A0ABR0BCI6_PURLI|nr:hypothetical protein Purlil1_14012 [Purpureocillium lilacinum]
MDWRHPAAERGQNCLAASCCKTRPELDKAVGLTGGIPQETQPELDEIVASLAASRRKRGQNWTSSGADWRQPAAKRGQNWTKQWGLAASRMEWRHPEQNEARSGRSSGADWRHPAQQRSQNWTKQSGRECELVDDWLYKTWHKAASVVSSSRGQLFWSPPRVAIGLVATAWKILQVGGIL